MSIHFRHHAREHLKQAKVQAESNEIVLLRAACLELRMAIECLVYDLLQAYLGEVNVSVMEKWQPKQVMDELLYVDPHADHTSSIAFGLEETPGVRAKKMQSLGTDNRFKVKWANKAHNALGSYLHEPTISQHKAGVNELPQKMRKTIGETIDMLEEVLSSRVFNSNFGLFTEFLCDCGYLIKRKEEFLREGKNLSCASCGLNYSYAFDEESQRWSFAKAQYSYTCQNPDCGSERKILAHEISTDRVYVCSECGDEVRIVQQYRLERISSD